MTLIAISEVCPCCDRENTFVDWDLEAYGMSAFCPVCGAEMVLCSMCEGTCDWDTEHNSCTHKK